ncbi:putative methyltransferase-domain-containing protein [Syncephalis plumigaleata]|nr:putative methyltransferase-domain-containing protein [Syncephalis plumigaleata]
MKTEDKSLDLSQLRVSTHLPAGLGEVVAASGCQLYSTREHTVVSDDNAEGKAADLDTNQDNAIVQDLAYGLAGKVWDAAYLTALYLSIPQSVSSKSKTRITLTPPPPLKLFPLATNASHEHVSLARDNIGSNGHHHRQSISLLELGSGTGYLGLHVAQQLSMAAQLYPEHAPRVQVTLTDLQEAQPLLQRNIRRALGKLDVPDTSSDGLLGDRVHLRARPLHWGSSEDVEMLRKELPVNQSNWDVIIGSDLVYFPELYAPLITTLCEVCSSNTTLIIGWRCRQLWRESPFWEQFGLYFNFEAVCIKRTTRTSTDSPRDEVDDTSDIDEEEYFLGEEQDAWVFVAHRKPIAERHAADANESNQQIDGQLARLLLAKIRI